MNSTKGEFLFRLLNEEEKTIDAVQLPFELATAGNPRILNGKQSIPPERERFFNEIKNRDWKYLSKKYIKPPVGLRGSVLLLGRLRRCFSKILHKVLQR